MVKRKSIISSESVTEGHPDKMCDLISDAILDEALRQDKNSRVAVETGTKNGGVMVFGEMTTDAYIDIPHIVRETIKGIGYTKSEYGIEWETCSVWVQITEQSPDISQGVTVGKGLHKEQGAGDQGMMYGYACNETKEFMPLPILLAHKLTKRLSEMRKTNRISYLRPDGKSQVSIEYDEIGKPLRAHTIVVSTQHDGGVAHDRIRKDVIDTVIKPVCAEWIDKDTIFPVRGQDLAPRAYLITPVKGNAVTMAYSFNDGELLLEGAAPITDATARLNVPNLAYYHSLGLFGRSANVTAGLAYGVGNFEGTVLGEQR